MQKFAQKKAPAKQGTLFGGKAVEVEDSPEAKEVPMDLISSDDSDVEVTTKAKANIKEKAVITYVPWVEKYRPAKIDEVSHQTEAVNALREAIKTGQLPHLLFYGPPGTGKTSTILALAKEMFG